jgi:cathepsin F
MFRFLFLTSLISFGVYANLAENLSVNEDISFDQWKSRYGKIYKNHEDEEKALMTWLQNKMLVKRINTAKGSAWRAELNKFADLTQEEFKKIYLLPHGIPAAALPKPVSEAMISAKDIPSAFDWRTDGSKPVVTSVKDQGTVGTCWAFSTMGNVEGQWSLAGHELVDLSPEYLVDCDGTTDGTHADCSVFGGWPYLAYQFLISMGGVPSEADWPYCSGTGDCYPCMLGPISACGPPPYTCDRTIQTKCPQKSHPIAATISNYTTISSDENIIVQELYSRGPLSVLLDATQLQFYASGVWDGVVAGMNPLMGCKDGEKAYLDHAVLMIGYGVESDKNYWIVKNSWGEDWGEKGYFRITRGVEKCGINTGVTSSIV